MRSIVIHVEYLKGEPPDHVRSHHRASTVTRHVNAGWTVVAVTDDGERGWFYHLILYPERGTPAE